MRKKRRAAILDVPVTVQDILRHFFVEKGYEVVSQSRIAPCLLPESSTDACLHKPPCADIVIMEFNMSLKGGRDLLLRQARLGCGIPVRNKAVIAGYLSVEQQRALDRLGCAWFLVPIDFSRLSDWIDTR